MKGLHLHFDCASGAAGDMTVGALVDLGVPVEVVREAIGRVGLEGWSLDVQRVVKGGIAATDVKVRVVGATGLGHQHGRDDHDHEHHAHHHHVHYAEIRDKVSRGLGGTPAGELALAIFDRVARAEAHLHGTTVDEVAFHELGAVDSIADIVGAAAALAWLAPASVSGSVVATGHGTIHCAHGVLPVPPPAVLEIARAAGMPLVDGGVARELLTPTGAAILAAVVQSWRAPVMRPQRVGYGAGDADLADRPNVLRAVLGVREAAAEEVIGLEANLDDMSPELCEHVAERLFAAGALDVWWTPVVMKKSRPAFVLGVLAPAGLREAIADVILTETTSLGVRWTSWQRQVLERRLETVETEHGPVVVKIGVREGRAVNLAPEYESCREVARARGVPLKEVYAAALAAARRR